MSAQTTVEFKHIRLKPADNGYILEYDEVKETPGSMENRDWNERYLVFSDDQIDDAMEKMKSMFLFNKMRKGDTTVVSPVFAESKLKMAD